MSEIKVNKISPKQTCTQLTLGDSGDTIIVTSGANFNTDAIKNLNTSSIITQTNATTITLGYSGSTIAIASGATQTGFGRSGSVNWDTTPKTANFTAVSGNGYFVDTTTTTLTVSLPAGVAGDIVAISDYANTAATNNITIDPNGTDKINGVNENTKITTNGASATLIYVDSTRGWKDVNDATLDITGIPPFIVATGGTILTCGDFKTHVFTGPGTFTVTCAGSPGGSNSVEYLVVAGGGGSGAGEQGGGGGAGGYRQNYPSPATTGLPVTAQAYPISIGSGGAGGGPTTGNGANGNPSVFSTITSTGGGAGGNGNPASPASPSTPGSTGGSGGGGGTACGTGASGNTPPVSPPQGNSGGNAGPSNDSGSRGGGGGGAGAVGAASQPGIGGTGSPIATTFFGPTSPSYGTPGPAPGRYFAGGGGGGAWTCASTPGGAGGGGAGAGIGPGTSVSGTVNTGGGGGGSFASGCIGASGGSGIVVIRYKFQ
jgi:hypothetical protein